MMIRLRELRLQRHITMKQLGSVLGLAESTISLYETGKRQPDLDTLVRFANYFDVSVDYILGRKLPAERSNNKMEDVFDPEKMSLRQWLEQHGLLEEYQALKDTDTRARALRSYGLPETIIQKELYSSRAVNLVLDEDSFTYAAHMYEGDLTEEDRKTLIDLARSMATKNKRLNGSAE